MDKCYVCEKEQVETDSCRIDNFMGSNLLMGWIYCKHCEAYVKMNKKMREITMDQLPESSYKHFNEKKVQFWRVSSNKNIIPYVQKNAMIDCNVMGAFEFRQKYKTFCIVVNWKTDHSDSLYKPIPLANLIFYNRNIFGYTVNNMIENILSKSKYIHNYNWYTKWKHMFEEHYVHANGWSEFCKISNRHKIPLDIVSYIKEYWGMFILSSS